jgi:hypothetical protein
MVKNTKPKTAKEILMSHDWLDNRQKSEKYISQEFQDFGLRLAHMLGDTQHKALYIKLAKKEERSLLEQAASFASDYQNARNKGRIFMWKLKELKAENKKTV